jgi:hypothetical protein
MPVNHHANPSSNAMILSTSRKILASLSSGRLVTPWVALLDNIAIQPEPCPNLVLNHHATRWRNDWIAKITAEAPCLTTPDPNIRGNVRSFCPISHIKTRRSSKDAKVKEMHPLYKRVGMTRVVPDHRSVT